MSSESPGREVPQTQKQVAFRCAAKSENRLLCPTVGFPERSDPSGEWPLPRGNGLILAPRGLKLEFQHLFPHPRFADPGLAVC
jgi:hypothetical protein